MIKRGIGLAGSVIMISAALSLTAFAAGKNISSVTFSYTIESDREILPGYNDPDITVTDKSHCDFDYLECSTAPEDVTGKSALTYSVTLIARNGYVFDKNVNVTGRGTESITRVTVDSDRSVLTVRFKAYPFFRLAEPVFETDFNTIKGSADKGDTSNRGSALNFNKFSAPRVDYVISYVDQDGNERLRSGSSSGSSLSVSPYNKQYTGTNPSKQSARILGIAMRASGTLSSNPNTAPSDWVYIANGDQSIDTEEFFDNYNEWGDIKRNSGSSSWSDDNVYPSAPGPQSPAGSQGAGKQNATIVGWTGSGDEWYYYNNGALVRGWLFDGSNWYYCDPSTGRMRYGWFCDTDGRWYYLNQNHDGTFGCMRAGWFTDVDGNVYYLNENHDGTFGCMVTGWVRFGNANYYFRPETGGPKGSMVRGCYYTINGITYYFAPNGVLTG